MTKGELIVRCIKLLNENNGEDIDATTISTNPEYKDRTTVIVPSINRALHRLEELKKLPTEKITIEYNPNKKGYVELEEAVSNDIMKITNVLLYDNMGNVFNNISYFVDGGLFILPPLDFGEKYVIIYQPKVKELKEYFRDDYTREIDDNEVIAYPDYILSCIPYYVKGDIFEEDEPQLAAYANNKFEVLAAQIPSRNNSVIRDAVDVYNLY